MHPYLVRPATVQRAFQQADASASAQDAILGLCRTSLPARDAHPLSMNRMPGDGCVDHSTRFPGNACHKCEIDFLHRSRGKLLRKIAVRRIILGHDETAARLFIESMNNSRPLSSPDAREIFAMSKQSVYQRVLLMARAGMHDQSSRLVQHEQAVILK